MARAKMTTPYGINVARTVDTCPELGPLIPESDSRYWEDGRLGFFYTSAYSRRQAMTQFLSTLGNANYRPRWAMEQLRAHIDELVEPVARRGNDIANFQLPMIGLLE